MENGDTDTIIQYFIIIGKNMSTVIVRKCISIAKFIAK